MSNIRTNLGGNSETGAMRIAHRFFTISAAALLVLSEAVIIDCFKKGRLDTNPYITWLLPTLVAMPMGVAVLFYSLIKKSALSANNRVDWHLARFLWMGLVFVFYSSLIIVIITLVTTTFRLNG